MAIIEGRGGMLRAGGRVVATLGVWTYEGKSTDWKVDAELLSHNPVWIEGGGPFELRLPMVQGGWLWRGLTDVQLFNGALVVRGTAPKTSYGVSAA